MLTVPEALQRVLEHARPKSAANVLLADSLGLVLAEDIASDIDSPPYDKSMVDGYAVRSIDFVNGQADLALLEEIMAGAVPTKAVTQGTCTRVMTGAPIPPGADAMVMQEQTEMTGGSPARVRIRDAMRRVGQNILRQGIAMRRGDIVLQAGRRIRPAEIGLLAEVGKATVFVIPAVSVAVLATGNELVSASERPAGGQIRNSNGPMLLAAARHAGTTAVDLGVARDEKQPLRQKLAEGLKSDVLVVAGGVSTGVLDLVPGTLAELGVREVFHKVRIKPGKPLWFGVVEQENDHRTLVFGLPGNPVSTFVCFELFVKSALAKMAGRNAEAVHRPISARLTSDFAHRGDRPTYQPAVLHATEQSNPPLVAPLRWAGSADLRGLVDANALIVFPAGDRSYSANETVAVLLLDS
jgi:molybdopterin molybdotransferase